jgi:hypothetical protein
MSSVWTWSTLIWQRHSAPGRVNYLVNRPVSEKGKTGPVYRWNRPVHRAIYITGTVLGWEPDGFMYRVGLVPPGTGRTGPVPTGSVNPGPQAAQGAPLSTMEGPLAGRGELPRRGAPPAASGRIAMGALRAEQRRHGRRIGELESNKMGSRLPLPSARLPQRRRPQIALGDIWLRRRQQRRRSVARSGEGARVDPWLPAHRRR